MTSFAFLLFLLISIVYVMARTATIAAEVKLEETEKLRQLARKKSLNRLYGRDDEY